jgi:ribosome-associated protein
MQNFPLSMKLEESELQFSYIRASGPGGQNVNKVATSVQLRFDVRNSPSLSADVKDRLVKLGGSKMTSDGILIIEAKRYRTQDQNKADAVQRLDTLINKASQAPILRQATRPTRASKEVRLESKKKRSEQKKLRQGGNDNHEW